MKQMCKLSIAPKSFVEIPDMRRSVKDSHAYFLVHRGDSHVHFVALRS
jgi:hypothetical protein